MYELALFAGAGGGLLATKHLLGWRTLGYIECESYCVAVLQARIRDGLLDDAPIWSDVRSFSKHNGQCRRFIRSLASVRDSLCITAGFPCQPFSGAGKRLGEKDKRNLWPHTIRIIREIRPRHVLLENTATLLCFDYIRRIFGDLAASGYDARWRVLSAAEVGAPHKRDRLWIVADDPGYGRRQSASQARRGEPLSVGRNSLFSNDYGKRRNGGTDKSGSALPSARKKAYQRDSWWAAEPDVGRVVQRMAYRVDRIRAIGNGQVPAVAACVWRLLEEAF